MKTKEELNVLKEEYTNLSKKLAELSEDELEQVVGGISEQLKRYRAEQARMEAWDLVFKPSDALPCGAEEKELFVGMNKYELIDDPGNNH